MRRLAVALALLVGSPSLYADDKPWAAGVSQDHQDAALALYKEGNAFFAQDQFKDALAKYDQALALWDHPAIRYNAAVCLINLDRPVEAYEDLQAAMRYGEPPLGADLYKQGLSYEKLLAGRIAEVDVRSTSPDAKVTLDGQPMPSGKRHVLSGDHQVVAEKPGYQTETKPVHVNGGDHVTIVIDLHPLEAARVLHRRYARWVPWTVAGAGAAVALVSIPFFAAASSSYGSYDRGINTYCTAGCPPSALPPQYATDLSHGNTFRALGFSMVGVGGAVLASGIALLILNQPHLVAPTVSEHAVGMTLSGRW